MRNDILTLEDVDVNDVIESFVNYFHPSGKFTDITGNIHVFIIEQYYFRAGSTIASTVIFEQKDQSTLVIHMAVAGGRGGAIFSGNAKKSMLKKLRTFLLE